MQGPRDVTPDPVQSSPEQSPDPEVIQDDDRKKEVIKRIATEELEFRKQNRGFQRMRFNKSQLKKFIRGDIEPNKIDQTFDYLQGLEAEGWSATARPKAPAEVPPQQPQADREREEARRKEQEKQDREDAIKQEEARKQKEAREKKEARDMRERVIKKNTIQKKAQKEMQFRRINKRNKFTFRDDELLRMASGEFDDNEILAIHDQWTNPRNKVKTPRPSPRKVEFQRLKRTLMHAIGRRGNMDPQSISEHFANQALQEMMGKHFRTIEEVIRNPELYSQVLAELNRPKGKPDPDSPPQKPTKMDEEDFGDLDNMEMEARRQAERAHMERRDLKRRSKNQLRQARNYIMSSAEGELANRQDGIASVFQYTDEQLQQLVRDEFPDENVERLVLQFKRGINKLRSVLDHKKRTIAMSAGEERKFRRENPQAEKWSHYSMNQLERQIGQDFGDGDIEPLWTFWNDLNKKKGHAFGPSATQEVGSGGAFDLPGSKQFDFEEKGDVPTRPERTRKAHPGVKTRPPRRRGARGKPLGDGGGDEWDVAGSTERPVGGPDTEDEGEGDEDPEEDGGVRRRKKRKFKARMSDDQLLMLMHQMNAQRPNVAPIAPMPLIVPGGAGVGVGGQRQPVVGPQGGIRIKNIATAVVNEKKVRKKKVDASKVAKTQLKKEYNSLKKQTRKKIMEGKKAHYKKENEKIKSMKPSERKEARRKLKEMLNARQRVLLKELPSAAKMRVNHLRKLITKTKKLKW